MRRDARRYFFFSSRFLRQDFPSHPWPCYLAALHLLPARASPSSPSYILFFFFFSPLSNLSCLFPAHRAWRILSRLINRYTTHRHSTKHLRTSLLQLFWIAIDLLPQVMETHHCWLWSWVIALLRISILHSTCRFSAPFCDGHLLFIVIVKFCATIAFRSKNSAWFRDPLDILSIFELSIKPIINTPIINIKIKKLAIKTFHLFSFFRWSFSIIKFLQLFCVVFVFSSLQALPFVSRYFLTFFLLTSRIARFSST